MFVEQWITVQAVAEFMVFLIIANQSRQIRIITLVCQDYRQNGIHAIHSEETSFQYFSMKVPQ